MGQIFSNMHLNQPKFFIALILENLGKKCDFVIIPEICFDARNNSAGPLNDKRFKSILLVQVCIHVLLHRL